MNVQSMFNYGESLEIGVAGDSAYMGGGGGDPHDIHLYWISVT